MKDNLNEWNWDMSLAPRDGTKVILYVERQIIEGYFSKEVNRWMVATLGIHGCGCCPGRDPHPVGWKPYPNNLKKVVYIQNLTDKNTRKDTNTWYVLCDYKVVTCLIAEDFNELLNIMKEPTSDKALRNILGDYVIQEAFYDTCSVVTDKMYVKE